MRIITISKDQNLIKLIDKPEVKGQNQLMVFNRSNDLLEVASYIHTNHPAILIVDDDFLKPDSAHLLRNVKKLNPDMAIVFITSDTGIELGKEVSQVGIFFYGLKPLSENELEDSIRSITKLKTTITQY